MDRMVIQNLIEQLTALVSGETLLKHPQEHVVKDAKESGSLLIRIFLVLAEAIVHVVEVKFELVNFGG